MNIEDRAQAAIQAIASLVAEMDLPLEKRNVFITGIAVRSGQSNELDEFLEWFVQ